MIQRPRTSTDYQIENLSLLARTAITQLGAGGKARAFLDICADQVAGVDAKAFLGLSQVQLQSATGSSLDALGETFGVARIGAQDAQVSPYDSNLKFYVRNGTFGSINGGRPIEIPSGIRVTTPGTNGPVFLLNAVTLNPTERVQYISGKSYYPGAGGNVAERTLTVHNFRNYTDSANGSLLVVNEQGITGGRDRESDENYRYRILLEIRGRNGANEDALRAKVLAVPGVQDVVFVPYAGGFYAYLYAIAPVVSTEVLQTAQRALNAAMYPIVPVVLAPDLIGISLSTTLKVRPMTTAAEKTDIANQARNAAAYYINNLRVGETLYINSLAARIRSADNRILDVGQVNNQIPEIFIWRGRPDGSRYSRYLVMDFEPVTGERIIVETSVTVPINIQVTE